MAVILVISASALPADDNATVTSSDGYHIVPVTVDGRTVPIKVLDSNPFKNVSSQNTSGPYNPQFVNFSAESSMANKKFDLPTGTFSQNASDLQHQNFVTKVYPDANEVPTMANLHTKAVSSTNSDYHKSAADFDKSYATSPVDLGQEKTSLLVKSDSDDQNRSALVNAKAIETPESSFSNQTFLGPEADAVHHHLTKTDDGKIFVSDLPNRALTIDEVRNLINHGFKPNTDAKPEEPSKPLNDPGYKPQPLREPPAPASEDDKNDPVPPPGTMAAPPPPENSEPLPQP
jgi:hypothetical protein